MDATQRLVDELRTHALIIGEVVLTSGKTAQLLRGRQARDPAARRLRRAGRARRRPRARVGRHRGRRPDDGRRPRRLRRAGRRLRRQGVLRPQGDQAARAPAPHRGSAAGRERPLRDRRGRRHHRRLDAPGDRGGPRGGARDRRRDRVLDRLAGGAEKIEAARPARPTWPARRSTTSTPIARIEAERARPRACRLRSVHVPAGTGPTEVLPTSVLRVLLVEDDDGDAFLFEELLRDADLDVVVDARAHGRRRRGSACPTTSPAWCSTSACPTPTASPRCTGLREAAPDVPMLVLTGLSATRPAALEAVAAGAQDYLVKGRVDGELLARSIRYAIERQRAEVIQGQLRAANLTAEENARLERGLLPRPLVADPRRRGRHRLPPRPRARAARRRLLRRGRGARRHAARDHRRRLRPRPGRRGARRLPADRLAHARARRPRRPTSCSGRWSRCWCTSASPTRSSRPRA